MKVAIPRNSWPSAAEEYKEDLYPHELIQLKLSLFSLFIIDVPILARENRLTYRLMIDQVSVWRRREKG